MLRLRCNRNSGLCIVLVAGGAGGARGAAATCRRGARRLRIRATRARAPWIPSSLRHRIRINYTTGTTANIWFISISTAGPSPARAHVRASTCRLIP